MQSQPVNTPSSSQPAQINLPTSKTMSVPDESSSPNPGNKKWLKIGIAVLIIVVIVAPVVLFLNSRKNTNTGTAGEEPTPFLPEADPRIQVELTPKDPGKTVLLKVSRLPKDINSLEYELKYKADSKSEGVFGLIKLDSGEDSIEREITLGTCSSGVCKYHNVTSKGQLTIKFNSSKGASRFQKEFDLL